MTGIGFMWGSNDSQTRGFRFRHGACSERWIIGAGGAATALRAWGFADALTTINGFVLGVFSLLKQKMKRDRGFVSGYAAVNKVPAIVASPTTRVKSMKKDILKTLKSEHAELHKLFDQMDDTTERAEKKRKELLKQIKQGLLPHAVWEEKVFYPAFKERADRDGRKAHAEAVQEHRAVELRVLPDLESASPTSTEFAGRAKVLGEFVVHHAKEEEKTMFAMAKKLFSAEELAKFDDDYSRWKKSAEGRKAVGEALDKAAAAARTNPAPLG